MALRAPLVCTHVAEGHSRAVLAVAATDDLLFSASRGTFRTSLYFDAAKKNISYLTLSLRQCHQVAKKLYMDILTTYIIQEIMLEVVSHHNLFFKMAAMFLEPKNL